MVTRQQVKPPSESEAIGASCEESRQTSYAFVLAHSLCAANFSSYLRVR